LSFHVATTVAAVAAVVANAIVVVSYEIRPATVAIASAAVGAWRKPRAVFRHLALSRQLMIFLPSHLGHRD